MTLRWRRDTVWHMLFVAALVVFTGSLLFDAYRHDKSRTALLMSVVEVPWTTFQAEFELQRLLNALDRYRFEPTPATHEEMARRIDIMWSRLPLLVEGSDSRRALLEAEPQPVVDRFGAALSRLEPDLERLASDPAWYQDARASLAALQQPMRRLVRESLKIAADAHSVLQEETTAYLYRHLLSLFGLVVGGGLLVGMTWREGRRARHLLTVAEAAQARIEHLAHHDALTQLPNRRLFEDHLATALAAARRHGGKVALHLVDLDRFKEINDTHGHPAGDVVLCLSCERIRACLRETDTVARLGGDEFAVIQPDVQDADDAETVASRIVAALRAPCRIGEVEVQIAASVGTTLYPDDGLAQADLLRNADLALYRAKHDGGDARAFFEPALDEQQRARKRLLHELRQAIEAEQLEIFYQPKYAQAGGLPSGVEALVRWRHPERGLLPPAAFIAAAEESGLIVEIGAWVLARACCQVQAWRQAHGLDLKVAVNLSAVQLLRDDMTARVRDALARSRLEPAALELEITESMVLDHGESVLAQLDQLRGLGVRICLDDFGTGYSSLGYLQRIACDSLKIDRSFAAGLGTQRADRLYKAVVDLAHGLDIAVVGEGVETADQMAQLVALGCDELQGFLLAPPEPAHRTALRLRARQPSLCA